jgi:hypothetical protein
MSRPTDVVIVHPDGTRTPCELAPLGPDDNGIDMWEIATTLHNGDTITVGRMPGRSGLSFPAEGWP